MGRTIDLSLSLRTRQYVIAGVCVACVLLWGVGLAFWLALPPVVVLPAAGILWVVLTVTWVRRLAGSGEGSTWAGIPQSQYLGRFAQSGGIARKEQEKALGNSRDDE